MEMEARKHLQMHRNRKTGHLRFQRLCNGVLNNYKTFKMCIRDRVRIDMAQIAAQQLREAGLDVKADVPAGGIDWARCV